MISESSKQAEIAAAPLPSPRRLARRWRKSALGLSPFERLAAHAVLLVLCVPALLPMLWMVSTSLKPDAQIFSHDFALSAIFPHPVKWRNYLGAVEAIPFAAYLENTLLLCAFTVVGAVGSSAIVAYGFAKTEFKGKAILFLLMISTMALPSQVTMVPMVAMFRWLHWYGTYLPLIIPSFFGAPFFIFLLTQFYRNLPGDLPEAARVDGAGEWRIFWQVMLPLTRPALVTCALFQFLGTWNDFLGPLLYINNSSKYTLAYGLEQFLGVHGSEYARLMAACTLFVLPIIVLFFFAQKTFIQGIATTGGKN
jgi:multiple sugar transport system permease protein